MTERIVCSGLGSNGDHCCYVGGETCPHLRHNVAGRRYACGLLLRYGSWEAMNVSPEYQPIADHWETISKPRNYCQTFDPSFCCRPEFRDGRHNENCPPRCMAGDL